MHFLIPQNNSICLFMKMCLLEELLNIGFGGDLM